MDSNSRLSLSRLSNLNSPTSPLRSVGDNNGSLEAITATTAALESQFALADEQTVNLMQEKVSQVHHWKLEAAKKDRLIEELQRQVDDLLPLREEVHQWKMELWLAEERLRLKEAELRQQHVDLQTAKGQLKAVDAELNLKARQMQDEITAVHQGNREKVLELQARLQTLEADLAQQEHANALLSRELVELTSTTQSERKLSSEREQRLCDVNQTLRQQVANLQQDLSELREKAAAAELIKGQADRDLRETMQMLERSKEEVESSENQCLKLMNKVNALSEANRVLSDTVATLRAEAEESKKLRSELGTVPLLRDELQRYRDQLKELEAQAQRSQQAFRTEEQETQRLRNLNAELQRQVSWLQAQVQTMEEAKETKVEVAVLRGDLEASKQAVARLGQELRQAVGARKEEEALYDTALQELHSEILQLHINLDAILDGKMVTLDASVEPRLTTEYTSGLKSLLFSFRSRLLDAATQWNALRERQKLLQQSLDNEQVLSTAIEQEKTKCYAECVMLKAQLEKSTTLERELQDEVQRWADCGHSLQQDKSALQAKLAEQSEAAFRIARRFVDQMSTLEAIVFETPPGDTQRMPPSVSHPSAEISLSLLAEFTEAAAVAYERVRSRAVSLRDSLTALTAQLNDTSQKLQLTVAQSQRDLAAAELERKTLLEMQQQKLTSQHQAQLEVVQKAKREVEEEAADLKEQIKELHSSLSHLKDEKESLAQHDEAQTRTVQKLQLNLDMLSSQLSHRTGQVDLLQMELDRARAQNIDLEGELEKAHTEIAGYQLQIEQLGLQIKSIASERDAARQETEAVQRALGNLQAQYKELQVKLEFQVAEIAHFQSDLNTANKTCSSLSSQLQQSKANTEVLQSRLVTLQEKSDRQWEAIQLLTRGWLWMNAHAQELMAQRKLFARHAHVLHSALRSAFNDLHALTPHTSRSSFGNPFRAAALAVVAMHRLLRIGRTAAKSSKGPVLHKSNSMLGPERLSIAPANSIAATGLPADFLSVEPVGPEELARLLRHLCSADALMNVPVEGRIGRLFGSSAHQVSKRHPSATMQVKAMAIAVLQRINNAESEVAAQQRRCQQYSESETRMQQRIADLHVQHATQKQELETQLKILQDRAEVAQQREQQMTRSIATLEATIAQQKEELAKSAIEVEKQTRELQARAIEQQQLRRQLDVKEVGMEETKKLHRQELDHLNQSLASQTAEGRSLMERLRVTARELDDTKLQVAQLQQQLSEEEGKVQRLERALRRKEHTLQGNAEMIKSLSGSHARVTQELANIQKELYEAQQAQQKALMEKQHWTKMRLDNLGRRIDAENALQAVLDEVSPRRSRPPPPPMPAGQLPSTSPQRLRFSTGSVATPRISDSTGIGAAPNYSLPGERLDFALDVTTPPLIAHATDIATRPRSLSPQVASAIHNIHPRYMSPQVGEVRFQSSTRWQTPSPAPIEPPSTNEKPRPLFVPSASSTSTDGSRIVLQQHYRDIQSAIQDIDASLQRTLHGPISPIKPIKGDLSACMSPNDIKD